MRVPSPVSVSRMNQRNPLLCSLLACGALLLAGCAAQAPAASNATGVTMKTDDNAVDFQKLAGTTWVAEDIDRQGVIDNLQSRLQIVSIAEVAGHGGCNSYHGPAQLGSATSLHLGPFATTRMMCAPAAMICGKVMTVVGDPKAPPVSLSTIKSSVGVVPDTAQQP